QPSAQRLCRRPPPGHHPRGEGRDVHEPAGTRAGDPSGLPAEGAGRVRPGDLPAHRRAALPDAVPRGRGMTIDRVDVVLELVKILLVVGLLVNVVPIMVWVERRGSALIQDRLGPNRVGPFGLIQAMADALKFILKEDVIPAQANKWLYTIAPMFGLIPALTTIAVVPWGHAFFIPTEIMYGSRVAGPCIVGASLLAIVAMLLGGAAAKYHRKPGYTRLNFTIGAIVAAALFLGALALIGVMFGIKTAGAV